MKPVCIVHLEDDPNDAELVRALLEESGLVQGLTHVNAKEPFLEALRQEPLDIVISDFALPGFDGAEALRLLRDLRPEVPLVYFSGTIGEDAAIEALVSGATDYVLKSNPKRLVPAVRRALRDAEDAREKKRLQEQFLHSQKMEAVGRLAGGIAHDFNNLLTAILGNSEFLLQALPAGGREAADALEIKQAAERAATLTRQLLTFSRKHASEPRLIDLNVVVRGVEGLLRRVIGADVRLETALGPDAWPVKADPSHIEQAVMNLAVNARDAMPRGGRLLIETANVALDAPRVSGRFEVPPGAYATISVVDTGTGFDPQALEHLFEPFFTTKEPGKGTGLGLSTVYGIIKQSGGSIAVTSAPGKGTTFQLYLPRVQPAA